MHRPPATASIVTAAPAEGVEDMVLELQREPKLLRVARVGQLLTLSRGTVYQLEREGALAGVRIGARSLRITRASVIAYLRGALRTQS